MAADAVRPEVAVAAEVPVSRDPALLVATPKKVKPNRFRDLLEVDTVKDSRESPEKRTTPWTENPVPDVERETKERVATERATGARTKLVSPPKSPKAKRERKSPKLLPRNPAMLVPARRNPLRSPKLKRKKLVSPSMTTLLRNLLVPTTFSLPRRSVPPRRLTRESLTLTVISKELPPSNPTLEEVMPMPALLDLVPNF